MKLAFLTPLYFHETSNIGGGERFVTNLARGLMRIATEKIRIEIISFGRRERRTRIGAGLEMRVLEAAGPPRGGVDAVSWGIPEALAEADLIQVHQVFTPSAAVAVLSARLQGKPVCVFDHGGASRALARSSRILDLADRVLCHSDYAASLLDTSARVVVAKGGADCEFFSPPTGDPRVRDRFLFVGRVMPHKGVDQLIRALPSEFPLTVCGQQYHDAYVAHLKALAVGKQVEFVSDVGDDGLRSLYRRAWATILPSVYEDCYGKLHPTAELMGLTLLESMACGTPAICARTGGMPEFVAHGETGFVYSDPESLNGYLRQLATRPELVEVLGRRGREAVVREFDASVLGAQMLDVYRELLA